MDKHDTAQKVADQLFDLERQLDHTLISAARLVGGICEARGELGLALRAGAPEVAKLTAAMEQLGAVRATVAEAHDGMAVLQRALRVRTNMAGGGEKPTQPDSNIGTHLHAVDGRSIAA